MRLMRSPLSDVADRGLPIGLQNPALLPGRAQIPTTEGYLAPRDGSCANMLRPAEPAIDLDPQGVKMRLLRGSLAGALVCAACIAFAPSALAAGPVFRPRIDNALGLIPPNNISNGVLGRAAGARCARPGHLPRRPGDGARDHRAHDFLGAHQRLSRLAQGWRARLRGPDRAVLHRRRARQRASSRTSTRR